MFPNSNPLDPNVAFFYEMGKPKKTLGNYTFRHANDTHARVGGTPRHALRGAVVTPLRLRGVVVRPITIPPRHAMTRNDTHQKTRVSSEWWPGARKEENIARSQGLVWELVTVKYF